MQIKTVNISLPAELLKAIDEGAKAMYANRSEYIRQAVVARLQAENRLDAETEKRVRNARLSHYLKSVLNDSGK